MEDTDRHIQQMTVHNHCLSLRKKTIFSPPVGAVTSLYMDVRMFGKINHEFVVFYKVEQIQIPSYNVDNNREK